MEREIKLIKQGIWKERERGRERGEKREGERKRERGERGKESGGG